MSKISSIERIWLEMPIKPVPWRNMIREIPQWRLIELFRVKLENGVEGIGEAPPYYTKVRSTDEAVQRAQGHHPAEIMWDDTLGCGLQMACFDAVAKLQEVPLWAVLGQKVRDYCHVGWWAIDMPAEDWISECSEALANSYITFKSKARPWFDLADQLERLCSTVPTYFKIDMDFNDFGSDPSTILALCKSLERFEQISIWESPIQQEDLSGNRHLRQHLSVAIAHHANRPNIAAQIEQQVCDGFVVEGPVSHAIQCAHICAAFNKPFWVQWTGTNLSAVFGLHLAAVMTHANWPAIPCHHLYADQFVLEPFVVENGLAAVPHGPGLGVSIDWAKGDQYRTEPQPEPYPHPGLLLRMDWPGGTKTYFAHTRQMWDEFHARRLPVFLPGVNLVRVEDDGSDAWREMFDRVQKSPVHEGG